MKFGIFDHVDDDGRSLAEQLEARLQMAEAYDRLGFHAYHVAEHHATPLGRAPSPSVLLAAMSQRTRRLKFGPLVYLLPIYHPLRLVEEVAMLDALSNGRLQLGVGPGASLIEQGFYGVEEADRRPRFDEALEILMLGMTSDRLNYKGRFWQFDDVPIRARPVQQPHPPLWYGAGSPDSIKWCAREGINMVTLAYGERVRQVTELYRSEWVAHRGSEADMPLIGVSRHVVVAETDEEALAIARPAYLRWRDSFAHLWIECGYPRPLTEVYPDSWDLLQERGNCCAGSPKTVRAFVEAEAGRGINYFLSWFAFGGMTVEQVTRSVELFASDVMPAFG
jgi:alkanesulfonate monooxygenase SsuD/methylene tetrahydromethanopterin reductase-like flavin-dependent oxidoreductase (luciferase family)